MGWRPATVNPRASGCNLRRRRDRSQRGLHRSLALRRPAREPLGAYHCDVVDAEKAEQMFQVRLAELRARAGRVDTAARDGEHDLLAAGEPLRTLLRVAEGLAGYGDPVDPCLELRGDREV